MAACHLLRALLQKLLMLVHAEMKCCAVPSLFSRGHIDGRTESGTKRISTLLSKETRLRDIL